MSGNAIDNPVGTLAMNELHPAVESARAWLVNYVRRHEPHELMMLQESFASVGLSGNRLAEVCGETPRRVLAKEPVGYGYYLGLVWTICEIEENRENDTPKARKIKRKLERNKRNA